MKKPLLILATLIAVGIGAVVVWNDPVRFRLESTSPSGNSHVMGLRFQGQNTHALDGTLRLFVSGNKSESKLQTSIPWGRDLAIKWKESNQNEAFVVAKKGRAMIELQINGSELKCTKGTEHLVDDPYKQAEQGIPPNER
jgi:hypothetical protein